MDKMSLSVILLLFGLAGCATETNIISTPYIPLVEVRRSPSKPEPEPMTSLDAISYLSSLKLGVNIASSFDSYPYNQPSSISNMISSETAWGNPMIAQALLNGIAETGFDIVRIPITWIGYIGDEPDYKVAENRLRRVAEVVDMAHNAGLKVIINIHHDDGSFNGRFYDSGWLRVDKAAKDREEKERITAKFQAVWWQIAQYFINYGDYLFFESFNELADENWGYPLVQGQVRIINEWNKVFVDTVRSTGGNNTKRFLIIPGYAAKAQFTVGKLVLPSDPMNNDTNKLIVAFHYYDPHEFSHELTMSSWGNASDKTAVDRAFNSMQREYMNKGIAVILDEFGIKYKADIADAQRNYISYIVGAATKRGMPALFWDDSNPYSGFMLFDRRIGRLFSFMESYVQAMRNAVN